MPGYTELVDTKVVCSMVQSMGFMHICDVASVSLDQADIDVTGACNGNILIYDELILLNEVWNSY